MYEERLVAFIDVLGFKNEIERKSIDSYGNENTDKTENIYDFISLLHHDFVSRNTSTNSTYKVSQFSDSLVISYSILEPASVFWTLMSLLYLHIDAINHGLVIRGAITFGKLVHDESHLFGPAMDEAYKIETEVANYPRIIVNKDLIEIARNNPNSSNTPESEEAYIKSLIKLDTDGFYYVDYFEPACEEIISCGGYFELPSYLDKLQTIINANENVKDVKIIQKYNWIKIRYNSLIKKYKEINFREDPEYADLADYFNNLNYFDLKS